MLKRKKALSTVLTFLLLIQCFSSTSFAMNSSEKLSINELRSISKSSNKEINIKQYEQDLLNVKTLEDMRNFKNKYSKFSIETETTYKPQKSGFLYSFLPLSMRTSAGDTKIETNTYYGGVTTYDNVSSQTIDNLLSKTLDIGMAWSHPAAGVLYTMLGFIEEPEYSTYSGIIQRTLHDYKVIEKTAYVYRADQMTGEYHWEPMAVSSRKETSAQINLVYYEDGRRNEPSNLDLGLVRTDTGEHFYDPTRLKDLAKNTLSPLNFNYRYGDTVHFERDEKFDY